MSDLKNDLDALRLERAPVRTQRRGGVVWILVFVLILGGAVGAWAWFVRERPTDVG